MKCHCQRQSAVAQNRRHAQSRVAIMISTPRRNARCCGSASARAGIADTFGTAPCPAASWRRVPRAAGRAAAPVVMRDNPSICPDRAGLCRHRATVRVSPTDCKMHGRVAIPVKKAGIRYIPVSQHCAPPLCRANMRVPSRNGGLGRSVTPKVMVGSTMLRAADDCGLGRPPEPVVTQVQCPVASRIAAPVSVMKLTSFFCRRINFLAWCGSLSVVID